MRLLILLLITSTALAEPVVSLNKGDSAPFQGFLFDKDREQSLRLTDQNLTYCNTLNTSLTLVNKTQGDIIDKDVQRIKLRDDQIDLLEKRNSFNDGIFTKTSYFLLGALITGLLAKGIYATK